METIKSAVGDWKQTHSKSPALVISRQDRIRLGKEIYEAGARLTINQRGSNEEFLGLIMMTKEEGPLQVVEKPKCLRSWRP